MVDLESVEGYKPDKDFVEDSKDSLIDLNSTHSKELFLLTLPFSNDLLSDIGGQELSLNLQNDGNLGHFESSTGKVYEFVSFAAQVPDETVFIDSSTEPKIAAKISRRVSIVHYPEPKEFEMAKTTKKTHKSRNSDGATMTTSQYFPRQSLSGRANSSKGSRQKSSLSEAGDPSNSAKRFKSKSIKPEDLLSNGRNVSEHSHGHSTGISSMSSDHPHGGKSKKRKHE